MKTCPFCHKPIPDSAEVCPHSDCKRIIIEHIGRKIQYSKDDVFVEKSSAEIDDFNNKNSQRTETPFIVRPEKINTKYFLSKVNKKLIFIIIFIIIPIASFIVYRQVKFSHYINFLETEIQTMILKHNIEIEQEELAHRKFLSDQDLISGRLAIKYHDIEMQKRLTYDAQYANTPREKTILEIMKISSEKTLSTQQVLHDVAVLASPKDADVVVNKYDGGYIVDVGFDMAVMTQGEEGPHTKHSTKGSLKHEVIEIISRVMKDLYDHCGYQGIYKIRVACEHGVMFSDYEEDDNGVTKMTIIYKCSISNNDAMKVSNWRSIPIYNVSKMLNVEHDEFPNLYIKTSVGSSFKW